MSAAMSAICTKPGIDGKVLATELSGNDACCPPTICNIIPCDFICQFVNGILPSGPMWDEAKRDGVIQITEAFTLRQTCDDNICYPTVCVTLVDHAIYAARKLWSYLKMFLEPVAQEASPFTAVQSLDFWLASLGWDDCLACEGEPSIANMLAEAPEELVLAVRRGIAIALARMTLRPIATVDAINWIIGELGCELTAEFSSDPWQSMSKDNEPTIDDARDGDQVDQGCVVADCTVLRPLLRYTIRLHSRTLRKVKLSMCDLAGCPPAKATTPCSRCDECEFVEGSFEPSAPDGRCRGGQATARLWPGVAAAMCIVRRMIPDQANVSITQAIC